MTGTAALAACPGCGALVPGGPGPTHAYIGASPGCWAAWGAFQARSFASPAIAAVQPLAVDVYAVQHPGLAERRAIQAMAVDELLGQQQVVIKSLETHYKRVEGSSGRWALISASHSGEVSNGGRSGSGKYR